MKVLEHAKDHVKEELKSSKERLESVSTAQTDEFKLSDDDPIGDFEKIVKGI